MSNTVCGNYIGTAANGAEPLGNTQCGVRIDAGAQDNTIGGATASVRNVISGNGHGGVYISDADTTGNTVFGNYIGTNISGTVALGNAESGIYIGGGAQNNTVGGATAGTRNVISGNGQDGVRITGSSTMSNTVSGNYIGTDINGTAVLTNALDGVYIFFGAQNNTIGGVAAGEGNVISGNGQSGVRISNSGTTSNTISGNYIGTDVSGTAALGNSEFGVYITNGAQNNTVGSDNVIAHNGWDGVGVNGSSTTGNTITQNSIFSNDVGIDLTAGANGDIGAPVIVATTVGSVNVVGTACAGCTVEIFESGDTDGEGETYVGDTTADAGGTFTVTVGRLSNPYLTATATDAVDGTSEFSAVFISTVSSIFLPLVLNNY
jgi:titin